MRYTLISLTLAFCLHLAGAGTLDVGCGGDKPSVGLNLLSNSPLSTSNGRQLKADQDWKPCNTEKKTKISGKSIKKLTKVKTSRSCCVACKEKSNCVAWTHQAKKKRCTLFKDSNDLKRSDDSKYTSGWLDWRLDGPSTNDNVNDGSGDGVYEDPNGGSNGGSDVYEDPSGGGGSDVYEDPSGPVRDVDGSLPGPGPWDLVDTNPDEESSPSPNWDSYNDDPLPPSPEVVPRPPSEPAARGEPMPGKVLYGRRINSHTPCQGNMAPTSDDCANSCMTNGLCQAWTFTERFNCGWVSEESTNVGLCYLMADVDPDNIFDASPEDYFTSGWI